MRSREARAAALSLQIRIATGRKTCSDRGAVLVHAILALMTFTTMSAFVIDYGMILVSRHQVQTAADAAALAGSVALAFDSYIERDAMSPAKATALTIAAANKVWGVSPRVTVTDVTFPICPDGYPSCVRVDVFRNVERGNPLPAIFGQLIGYTGAGVAATATAEAKAANAVECLKPFAIPDKWIEHYPTDGPWVEGATFETEDKHGEPLPHPDVYIAPTAESSGTGFTLQDDLGAELVLKIGDPSNTPTPGWFQAIELPGSKGGSDYRDDIATCNPAVIAIGDRIRIKKGNMTGPTRQGIRDLLDRDPGAFWSPLTHSVEGSCAAAVPRCGSMSPRIVAIAAFDMNDFATTKHTGSSDVAIVNILGVFIDRMVGDDVTGHFVMHPGVLKRGGSTLIDSSSFLRASILVR
jgi:Flp pilus assembly protein TadG